LQKKDVQTADKQTEKKALKNPANGFAAKNVQTNSAEKRPASFVKQWQIQ